MQNASGEVVDLYIPRKCSWTNRILAASDFGAVQINVADIDPVTGVSTKTSKTYALCGFVRQHGEGDEALTALTAKADSAATN
eukprot:CAMPEP_0116899160 /NCGR_PEP_ID=MMETSP0467-20121206/7779_1 /TAXON_ID=283647 /ORGANISM="Mesodinium pulex, Strain SPMC105" /LENGTH=82 /DNA_ID=CAMNT_0004571803 /DNA_START=52 /DNA_END=300 /DNA_ORIENTATION=-